MTERIPSSLSVSVLSHAAVMVVAALLLSSVPKIEIHPTPATSFVLVSSEVRAEAHSPSANTSTPLFSPPRIPTPVIKQPVISHASDSTSLPQVSPQKSSTSPLALPKPIVSPRARMSFDDYQKLHAEKPTVESTVVTPVAPPDFPKTNPASVPNDTPTSQAPLGDDAQLQSFNAELVQKLRAAYRSMGTEDSALHCRIEFVLSAAGRVASSRILKSSGNAAFDNAVLDALSRVSVSGPPQTFIGVSLRTTFQIAQ